LYQMGDRDPPMEMKTSPGGGVPDLENVGCRHGVGRC